MKTNGSVAAQLLLTPHQRNLILNSENRIESLKKEREELRANGDYRAAMQEKGRRTVEDVSNELANVSREISKLQRRLDYQIDALIDDLDCILASNTLRPWISHRVSTWNQIAKKLANINSLGPDGFGFGPDYGRQRIVSTKSRPARYWLNENYVESRKYRRIVSFASPGYPLIGIKGNWTKLVDGKHVYFSKRQTLGQALEYEQRLGMNIIPRLEKEAISLKKLDDVLRKTQKVLGR
jgi:hypothetical protein